jgi:hypothetical protein
MAGARNFREAGDPAADLPAELLLAAGARTSPRTARPEAPSAATINRVVGGIDARHADALVGAWIADCVTAWRAARDTDSDTLPEGLDWLDGLAIDGKTVRNSATPGGMDIKLFSALLHREQVVIAQIAVPGHTTETTQVPALLDPVDLTGKTVTADAAHTQDTTADYLVNIRHTDYVLPVKGNRPGLLTSIVARMPHAVAGSAHHTDEQSVGGRRAPPQPGGRGAAARPAPIRRWTSSAKCLPGPGYRPRRPPPGSPHPPTPRSSCCTSPRYRRRAG